MSVERDIELARIRIKEPETSFDFGLDSSVYKYTNEFLCGYDDFFEKRKKMLSIIGSADQILTAIAHGTYSVDAVDISTFPKYFMYLKMAAIKVLTPYNYAECFFSHQFDSCDNIIISRIVDKLEEDAYIFFDTLLSEYTMGQIYDSPLILTPGIRSIDSLVKTIRYTVGFNYYMLRDRLPYVNINTSTLDMLSFRPERSYDLIYLSNIEQYKTTEAYLEFLNTLKLNPDGVMINYFFGMTDRKRRAYEKNGHQYVRLPNYDSVMLKRN